MVSKTINQILHDLDYIEGGGEVRLAYYLYTLQNSLYFESFSIRINQNMVISRIISKGKTNASINRVLGGGLVDALAKDILGGGKMLMPKIKNEEKQQDSLDLLSEEF